MAKYHACPKCGNTEKESTIYLCESCGRVGCFKKGGIFSSPTGCWTWGNKETNQSLMPQTCPGCGKANFFLSHKEVGVIE